MGVPEWEWRKESPEVNATLEALDVWGAYAIGEQVRLLVLQSVDDEGEGESCAVAWTDLAVFHLQRDGISGYEVLGDYGSLDEAKAAVEVDRIQLIEMIRESE